jgi:hypothetical protein
MGQLWQDSQITVKLEHDIWDITSPMMPERTTQTGQSGQVSLDRSARTAKRGQDARTARTVLWGQVSWV